MKRMGLQAAMALLGMAAALALGPIAAQAQAPDAALSERIARLERDLSREESLRAAKQLQIAYAHYSEFGLWNEMAQLFADDGELVIGDESWRGRDAILLQLTQDFGGGRLGLLPGGVSKGPTLTRLVEAQTQIQSEQLNKLQQAQQEITKIEADLAALGRPRLVGMRG